MTGQLAGPSIFSLELVVAIVAISMIAGTVDLIRQPGWAWKSAEESKAAYLVLVLLLPLAGLGMYLFIARPKVAKIASAGRAASLPFERFGEEFVQKQSESGHLPGMIVPPAGLGSFGGVIDGSQAAEGVPAMVAVPVGAATFFSNGGTATATVRPQIGLARPYRPKQRTSLQSTQSTQETETTAPAVPAGWKADPTGRHQFRYWDGSHWSENVADKGVQAMDSIRS